MKHISSDELKLFKQIKEEKSLIDIDEEIFSKTGKHPNKNYKQSKANIVYLANCINSYEDVGEVASFNDLGENERFIKWFNTLDSYLRTKKEEMKNE